MSHELLDPDEGLRRILAASTLLPAEDCALASALGRVLAAGLTAKEPLPPFDNSAMDGFALAGGSAALRKGSEFPITGLLAAGDATSSVRAGACEIMTGARMPDAFDRVVPVEQVERFEAPARIRLLTDLHPQQNVRTAGSDVAPGESIAAAGTQLAAQQLMLLAALGVTRVTVRARPRVAVLCTGRELVDDPVQALAPGQIHNSNGPFLAARVPLAGAELVYSKTVGDDAQAFGAALHDALMNGAQVIVSTGAVSMGRYDFVPQALEEAKAQVLFHKLAIRPGKPLLFARLPEDALFFGLPGNPISVAVGLRFFVEPALRVMLGLPGELPWRAPLTAAYAKKPRLRCYLKARLGVDTQGRLAVSVLPGQESYRIRPLAQANAWAVVPDAAQNLAAGTLLDVYGLGHLEAPMLEQSAMP